MADSVSEDYIQKIMNIAYAEWQKPENKRWDFASFVANLTRLEAAAVTIGKLHQQVCNGGFTQWLENGYSKENAGETLVAELTYMAQEGSEVAQKVLEWVKEALEHWENYEKTTRYGGNSNSWEYFYADMSALDDRYYALVTEETWFPEVEAYLRKVETDPEYKPLGVLDSVPKPKVKVVRGDNVFAIIGAVRKTIRAVFGHEAADVYLQQATSSKSYEAVLRLSKQHVHLTYTAP